MNATEHDHQSKLFEWAFYQRGKYPELQLMFAIPNGGHRHITVAQKLKAEGVKAGIPDIFLPVARSRYHGLFIEMKRPKGIVQTNQKEWIQKLREQNYEVKVCYGYEDAVLSITNYLNGNKPD